MVQRAYVPKPSNPSNETIAAYMQAGIWGVVLLLIVASLPRAYMRWRHPSTRRQGLKLKTTKPGGVNPTIEISLAEQSIPREPIVRIVTNESYASASSEEGPATIEAASIATMTQSRIASWGSLFFPTFRYLHRRSQAERSSSLLHPPAPVFERRRTPLSQVFNNPNAAADEGRTSVPSAIALTPPEEGEDHSSVAIRTYSRIASWGSTFYPAYRHLERPVWWVGYSVGLTLAFVVYTGMVSFGIFYHNLPSFSPRRAGWIVVGQVPFIVFLGTKNNLLGFVLGTGYDKLNVWHRWVGKTMFIAQMAHVIGYLVLFAKEGILLAEIRTVVAGWIAFSGFLCLCLFSLPAVRASAYRLFWHTHWVGYMLMFVGMSFHVPNVWHYAVAGFGILAIDHVFRLCKTTFVIANITAIPELKCTRIECPQLTRGWRAGQHVRLRTVSMQMGCINLFEAHPFTIASVAENTNGEGLVLYAKACGDWTNRLYGIASDSGSTTAVVEKRGSVGSVTEQGTRMRMIVEGPYGGSGHDVMSTFSSAFIVAGGSGITWALSTLEEIIRDAELKRANTRLIHLVWVVQDPAPLKTMLPGFQALLKRIAFLSALDLTINVYYTRAISHDRLTELAHRTRLPTNIRLTPGRPRLEALLTEFASQTQGLAEPSKELDGLVIGMCGPLGLRDSVEAAQRILSKKARDSVGGVEVVIEAFGW
ncbi:hypothetical protein FRB94_010976 [Tulasnella sp. JGI-2019a]|nr:hypothetical protein FRB94_010976 [Tulasnella sp. JGI-2019a]